MPKPVEKCCGTCIFADFERTPTGRIKKDAVSRCGFPINTIPERVLPFGFSQGPSRQLGIWPTDGKDCTYHKLPFVVRRFRGVGGWDETDYVEFKDDVATLVMKDGSRQSTLITLADACNLVFLGTWYES